MGCQGVKRRESSSNDKRPDTNIIQRLKRERLLREELNLIVEYVSFNDIPREERRRAAEEPLYLARYE
jgi:hypothetical protein